MSEQEFSENFVSKAEEKDDISESMGEEEEELSNHQEESREPGIKRRIRVGKKYHHIKNTIRKQLISRVESKGEKIIEVAKELGMKYSTAKSILKVYRSEGRTNKIPKSQRYLSLRVPDPDDFLPIQTSSKRKSKKSNTVEEEAVIPDYGGPVTRLRSSNRVPKERFPVKSEETESTSLYNEDEEEEEVVRAPKLKKKVKKEIVTKEEPEDFRLKEEVEPETFTDIKREEVAGAIVNVKVDEDNKPMKSMANELTYEAMRNYGMPRGYPHQMFPGGMPGMFPMANFNQYPSAPYSADISQMRIQNMAMYLQAIRLQGLMLKNRTAQNLKP